MQFDKDHKVDIKTLDEIEAKAFIEFLYLEMDRHNTAIIQANAFMKFWESALRRHKQDRDAAEDLIKKVEKEILHIE